MELFSSGGGGFGDPKQRAIEKVVQDVRDGLVSMESAQRDYGVVMDPTTFVVDEAATVQLRNGRSEKGATHSKLKERGDAI